MLKSPTSQYLPKKRLKWRTALYGPILGQRQGTAILESVWPTCLKARVSDSLGIKAPKTRRRRMPVSPMRHGSLMNSVVFPLHTFVAEHKTEVGGGCLCCRADGEGVDLLGRKGNCSFHPLPPQSPAERSGSGEGRLCIVPRFGLRTEVYKPPSEQIQSVVR